MVVLGRGHKARLGNPPAGSRTRRSNSFEAQRTWSAVEFRGDTVCLSRQTLREPGGLLAGDALSRRAERSAREIPGPRMEVHARTSHADDGLRSKARRRSGRRKRAQDENRLGEL